LPLRIFVGLLLAVTPPLLVVGAAFLVSGGPGGGPDSRLVATVALGFTLGWAAILTVIYTRWLSLESQSLVALAEQGTGRESADDAGTAYRRMADSLDERNRQVAELAARVSNAPINDPPRIVAHHVVQTARQVTRDPTWLLAVLISQMEDLLPAGIYGGDGAPQPLEDLQRWASVAATEGGDRRLARRLEGPWGAFVVVQVEIPGQLGAILYAPWEGRARPSEVELDMLSLLGQHAATALDHALLYSRLRAQADAIDRMAAIQTDFLRGVSHDLQTPLTSIRAVAADLRSRPGLSDDALDDLELIANQADRLRRMVGQLLAVSRLEAGAMEPRPEVLNPRPLVERTWSALRATDHRLDLEVTGAPHLVVADPDRLEQVLWAVLDNAVKYSPPGTAVRVVIGAADGHATISISDDGPGMDDATTDRAFDQFFRADAARRLAPDGSGIGLYAARGLMEAMGGSVSLESALGKGTTVSLEIPAEPVDEPVVDRATA
jgi:signal transduction histidine kinase